MTLMFRLYDDVDKGQFHCDGCGICRSGMIEYYKQCFVLCYSQFPIRGFLELYFRCHIKQIGLCLRENACNVLPKKNCVYFNCV